MDCLRRRRRQVSGELPVLLCSVTTGAKMGSHHYSEVRTKSICDPKAQADCFSVFLTTISRVVRLIISYDMDVSSLLGIFCSG